MAPAEMSPEASMDEMQSELFEGLNPDRINQSEVERVVRQESLKPEKRAEVNIAYYPVALHRAESYLRAGVDRWDEQEYEARLRRSTLEEDVQLIPEQDLQDTLQEVSILYHQINDEYGLLTGSVEHDEIPKENVEQFERYKDSVAREEGRLHELKNLLEKRIAQ